MFLEFTSDEAVQSAARGGWMINGRTLTTSITEFNIFHILF